MNARRIAASVLLGLSTLPTAVGGCPVATDSTATVEPKQGLDLFAYGCASSPMALGRVTKAGDYEVIVRYRTDESDVLQWLGREGWNGLSIKLEGLLRQVPLVDLADSIRFSVRE